jgi:hypothetical protein
VYIHKSPHDAPTPLVLSLHLCPKPSCLPQGSELPNEPHSSQLHSVVLGGLLHLHSVCDGVSPTGTCWHSSSLNEILLHLVLH